MAKKIFTDESLTTFVDEIKSYTDSSVATVLPTVSSDDAGKFLRVSSDGVWSAVTVSNAEEASF